MRVLALDIGLRRVGVAVSDPTGLMAHPLETVEVTPGPAWMRHIGALCQARGIEQIVVGLPLDAAGRPGAAALRTRKIVAKLRPHLGDVPIAEIDERLSSRQAENLLREGDLSREQRKQTIDRVAASLLLQTWLDQRRGRA